ncbi:MAG: DUF192 domain-containing protein [Candidatus Saccharimonadales bacterium]
MSAHKRYIYSFIFIGVALSLLLLILLRVRDTKNNHSRIIRLNSSTISVVVADNNQSRERGLSGTHALAKDHGMLFLFDTLQPQCFWMKDMLYNLDILWFDDQYSLIYAKENAKPSEFPLSYCSQKKAKYVVELPSGSYKRLHMTESTKLEFKNL